MEPPPPPLPSAVAPTATVAPPSIPPPATSTVHPHATSSYPDSVDSSPRSRTADGWDDLPAPAGGGGGNAVVSSKIRLMCSYGGHIIPRPHDKSLCYIGGDTRIVVVDRNISLSALSTRLSNTLLNGRPFTLKYQLPSEDLDSLISVTTDEDLDNMIEEYDRTISSSNSTSGKPSRLRLFLFPSKPEATQSMGQILESSVKSDDWFLNALNNVGLNRGFSDSDTNVNCLLGLDDGVGLRYNGGDNNGRNLDLCAKDVDSSVKSASQQHQQQQIQQSWSQQQQQQQQQQIQQSWSQPQGGQDVHSVPESPMLDSTSSFGSTSSSPLLANLPPIRVHVEEAGGVKAMQDHKLGIEDQFAQFNVVGGATNKQFQQQQEEAFAAISSPPPVPETVAVPVAPVSAAAVSGEFHARVTSDDERSDHGIPVGYRKPPTPRSQPQNPPPQAHMQKSNGAGHELPSPDSGSSESSMNDPLSRQKPTIYQDPVAQMPSSTTVVANQLDAKANPSDQNARIQIQDSGYILRTQFEQQSTQSQQPQPQQQFIHATPYIHHHPSGAVPMPTYIQVYPSQQQQQQPLHRHPAQLDQQHYPVYYISAPLPGTQPTYNMPMPQSGSVNETPGSVPSSHPQASPNPTMMVPPPNAAATSAAAYNPLRNISGSKPEMGSGGIYTTAPGLSSAQLVQVPSNQQFVGYSQIHHQPQSVTASGSVSNPSHNYEFADPMHTQIYYTQPLVHAQYQTMTAPATMVLPDGSAAKLLGENMKQQMRSSQPL